MHSTVYAYLAMQLTMVPWHLHNAMQGAWHRIELNDYIFPEFKAYRGGISCSSFCLSGLSYEANRHEKDRSS
jgi:hypothetical protein